ncbi:hypothetical protein OG339_47430 (plasmid) [Streptosporangium sp. NBC_01495]|uniref:effector-associated constant component EACC1 n=1 Tax=Streptosporangium sp. NBC_01495 TaxID=2903899 RepID=UPI002E338DA8|nr:hypothetical protein [Streptosporangium sp. NBC_01495]
MALLLMVDAEHPAEELRELHTWLGEEPELRGRVRLVESDPPPGALGPVLEGLQIAFGAGGAVATVASVVIAWLGTRKGEVTVTVTRGSDEVQISAKGIKGLDIAAAQGSTGHIVEVLGRGEAADGDE